MTDCFLYEAYYYLDVYEKNIIISYDLHSLIILTLSGPNQGSKKIELSIPYSNKEECLKASKNRFFFKFPEMKLKLLQNVYLKNQN